MNVIEHNRAAWNGESAEGGAWSTPVTPEVVAAARAGSWSVILTPTKSVPAAWFGDLRGKDVLCLASGGGQQAPVLAAAGARVVSFDLSNEQLDKDRRVAERVGLTLRCVRDDMRDLSPLADEAFDLIFHPVSNVFVPHVAPVWRGCHRVLRPDGRLLPGMMNPCFFMFDHDEVAGSGAPVVRYPLPYEGPTASRATRCGAGPRIARPPTSVTPSGRRSAARSRPDSPWWVCTRTPGPPRRRRWRASSRSPSQRWR